MFRKHPSNKKKKRDRKKEFSQGCLNRPREMNNEWGPPARPFAEAGIPERRRGEKAQSFCEIAQLR